MKTRSKFRQWDKPSITSLHTNNAGRAGKPGELGRLIEELPPERAEPVFTHAAWAPSRAMSYERLEFLGDSVLELAIARTLYERYPEFSEGRLAKVRSHVVSRASCAVVARELGLGTRLAEQATGLPQVELERLTRNRNVLAALLEAALAALFLEHGFEAIEQAIVAAFSERIEYALTTHVDYKTELQEALARAGRQVSYSVLEVEGPPHERTFTCAAVLDGETAGIGTGPSKKAAEQEAARQVLEKLGLEPVEVA
jgi:ribonuclease-3